MTDKKTNLLAVGVTIVVMIAIIVGVDILFFRTLFWDRLIANIAIVLVFVAFYLRVLRKP